MARDFLGDVSRLMGSVSPIASRKTVAPSAKDIRTQIEAKVELARAGKLKAQKLFGDEKHVNLRDKLRRLQEEYLTHRNMLEHFASNAVQGGQEQLTLQALELQEAHYALMKEVEYLQAENNGILYDDSYKSYKHPDRLVEKTGAMRKEEWDYLYETIGHMEVGARADGQKGMSFADFAHTKHEVAMDESYLDEDFIFFNAKSDKYLHEVVRDKDGNVVDYIDRRHDPQWLNNWMVKNIVSNETLMAANGDHLKIQMAAISDLSKMNKEQYDIEMAALQKEIDDDNAFWIKHEADTIVRNIGRCMEGGGGFQKAPDEMVLDKEKTSDQTVIEMDLETRTIKKDQEWQRVEGAVSINESSYGKCRDAELLRMEQEHDFDKMKFFDREKASAWLTGEGEMEKMFGDPQAALASNLGGDAGQWNFIRDFSVAESAYQSLVNHEIWEALSENGQGYIYIEGEEDAPIPTHTEDGRINPKAYTTILAQVQEWQSNSNWDKEKGFASGVEDRLKFTSNMNGTRTGNDPLFFSVDGEGSLGSMMTNNILTQDNFEFEQEVDGEMKSDYLEFTSYANSMLSRLPKGGAWTPGTMANVVTWMMDGSSRYVGAWDSYAEREAVNPNAAGKNGIDNSDLLNSLKSIDDQQVEDWKEYIGLQEDVKKTWSDFDSDPLSMKGYWMPFLSNAFQGVTDFMDYLGDLDVKAEAGLGFGFGDVVHHDDWSDKVVNNWRSRIEGTKGIGSLNLIEQGAISKGMWTDPETGKSVSIIDPNTGNIMDNWKDVIRGSVDKKPLEGPKQNKEEKKMDKNIYWDGGITPGI